MGRYRNVLTGVTVSTDLELDPEWESVGASEAGSGYESQKVDELKAEIDSRNEGRDEADQIVPDGTKKADLITALEADDTK